MKEVNFYCGKVNSQGGSKISLLNTLYLFNKENKTIRVFVNKKGWFTEQLDSEGISYIMIREPYFIEKVKRDTNIFLKIFFLLLSAPKLVLNWIRILKIIPKGNRVVINENRDIILFFPFFLFKKVKIVQWVRAENIDLITGILLNKVDEVIAVSNIVKKNVCKKVQKSKPVVTIYNFMSEQPGTPKNKVIDQTINFAVIGSIQKIKGQMDAVKVISSIKRKDIKLYIIGREFDQKYSETLKDYVNSDNMLKKRVHFLGHIDNIPDFLNQYIHLTLIPSQTESFCRVAMESISVGVPVVAYNVGGLKEVIIDEKTGILVNKNNIKQMSLAIDMLLEQEGLYKRMSDNAIEDWKARFYSENIKEQLFKVLT